MNVDVAPDARPLDGDRQCNVAILGAGIAGISTAYELALKGQQVIVVDRGRIAGGITARTSAHLAPLCDDLTSAMIKLRGEKVSRAFYESQASAVDRIEEIQRREKIDCDFRRLDGYLFQAPNTDRQMIDEELDAVRKVGAPVHRLVGVPLAGCDKQHALRYPRQATFHPFKYLKGLAAATEAKGGTFHPETMVEQIEERDDGLVVVTTDRGTITASAAVVATNSPIIDSFALHMKMAPYRTYAMAFSIPNGAIPDALYWDTLDPYHYVRLQPVHTGDSGQGMTHGVVGSLINSALILGENARWHKVYEPTRKTPSAISNYLRENLTAVRNFAEYLAPGELSSLDELKPGQGAIVRKGLTKIAAYRDKGGVLQARSAACTHIGCHLHWNSFEVCWDCPCHGSQFAVDGTALNAPAISRLAEVKIQE
jgi:Rieske Fe-S protein